MARRRPSALQAKEQKQKKIAAGLAIVLVAVLAIQVPKLMKQLDQHAPPEEVAAPAPAAQTPAAAAATTAASAPVQLQRFSRLRLKDPFAALVQLAAPAPAAQPPAAPAPKPKPRRRPKPVTAAKPATGTVPFTAKLPPPNAAVVRMNGKKQTVLVGDGFPAANPLFRLVALGDKSIRIGVFGGSFTSGDPTIRLAAGKKVTLANEADGSRYVLELIALTTTAAKPAPGGGAAAPTGGAGAATTASR